MLLPKEVNEDGEEDQDRTGGTAVSIRCTRLDERTEGTELDGERQACGPDIPSEAADSVSQ